MTTSYPCSLRWCLWWTDGQLCIFGSLPAVHLLQLADAGPFDRGGGGWVVKRKSRGATATCPQLLSRDGPHGPRGLLLWLVFLLFRSTRGHSLEQTQRTLELNSQWMRFYRFYRLTVPPLNDLNFHFVATVAHATCAASALLSFFDLITVTYAAAEGEAAEFSSILSRPCVAVLLWQQQNEGHSQRQMVEAVDIGVVPLLQSIYSTSSMISLNIYLFKQICN